MSTDEDGGTDTVMVSLTTMPSAAVTLSISSSDPGEATVSPPALTFGTGTGAGGWDTAQPFTVTGKDDSGVDDGEQNYTIVVRASSADDDYDDLIVEAPGVNVDDDIDLFALSPEGTLSISLGETATLSVSLVADLRQSVEFSVMTSTVTVDTADGKPAVSLMPMSSRLTLTYGESEAIQVSIAEDAVEEEFSSRSPLPSRVR